MPHFRFSTRKLNNLIKKSVSFQFYERLITIDLSSNIVEDIEDKSFAAQISLTSLVLAKNRIKDLSPKVIINL